MTEPAAHRTAREELEHYLTFSGHGPAKRKALIDAFAQELAATVPVPPADQTTDRAAVLRWAADRLADEIMRGARFSHEDARQPGLAESVMLLRRWADCPACEARIEHAEHCPTPETHNWGCGCPSDVAAAIASCPGYEMNPSPCRCPCEGCKHHCAAHNPDADEAQQPETLCGRTTSVTRTEYPPCARPAGHPEAYCRSADGKQHFLALYGPRPATSGPCVAGEQQNETPEAEAGCAHCGKTVRLITGTLAEWWVHDPGGNTICVPGQAASSPRATPKPADETQHERPRCPHCQMPHDLTPGSVPVATCAGIRHRIAEAERSHAEGEHSLCCRDECEALRQS